MKKKNFKVYEAPEVEIVEMESVCPLLAGSVDDDLEGIFPPTHDGKEV